MITENVRGTKSYNVHFITGTISLLIEDTLNIFQHEADIEAGEAR